MVPQQQDSPSSSGIPMFGSLLVDKNSTTPYSDATQVRITIFFSRNVETRPCEKYTRVLTFRAASYLELAGKKIVSFDLVEEETTSALCVMLSVSLLHLACPRLDFAVRKQLVVNARAIERSHEKTALPISYFSSRPILLFALLLYDVLVVVALSFLSLTPRNDRCACTKVFTLLPLHGYFR